MLSQFFDHILLYFASFQAMYGPFAVGGISIGLGLSYIIFSNIREKRTFSALIVAWILTFSIPIMIFVSNEILSPPQWVQKLNNFQYERVKNIEKNGKKPITVYQYSYVVNNMPIPKPVKSNDDWILFLAMAAVLGSNMMNRGRNNN